MHGEMKVTLVQINITQIFFRVRAPLHECDNRASALRWLLSDIKNAVELVDQS